MLRDACTGEIVGSKCISADVVKVIECKEKLWVDAIMQGGVGHKDKGGGGGGVG